MCKLNLLRVPGACKCWLSKQNIWLLQRCVCVCVCKGVSVCVHVIVIINTKCLRKILGNNIRISEDWKLLKVVSERYIYTSALFLLFLCNWATYAIFLKWQLMYLGSILIFSVIITRSLWPALYSSTILYPECPQSSPLALGHPWWDHFPNGVKWVEPWEKREESEGIEWGKRKESDGDSISGEKSSVWAGVGWRRPTFHRALLLNQVPTYGSRGYKPI